jgi:hypothetical protein
VLRRRGFTAGVAARAASSKIDEAISEKRVEGGAPGLERDCLSMSDVSQGEGWWLATDGKWYPPQQAPLSPPPGQSTPGDMVQRFPTTQPTGALGKPRRPWVVAVLTIVTLGIYGLYWHYASFQEMKDYSGQGVGGVAGLLLAIFISIVNIFLLPAEIGNLYFREARARPVSAVTGFWIFLPIVGWFVWVIKCQRRLNEFWIAHGATAV